MLAWYTSFPHTNTRVGFPEFGAAKGAGKYTFGSLPVLFFPDGTQMAQTQSIARFIAGKCKGKKGESMYPGKANPEASFDIDETCEWSDSCLPVFSPWMKGKLDEPAAIEFAKGEKFHGILKGIDNRLDKNGNNNFIVGNHMTIADTAVGGLVIKVFANPQHPYPAIFAAELAKYPRVKQWIDKTIQPCFKDFMKVEPIGSSGGCM